MPIRDLGYKRYDGPRLPLSDRYKVLVRRVLALQWASGLVKTTLILGMFPMVVAGVVVFVKLKAMHVMAAQGVDLAMEDPGNWVFYCTYWCQIWFAFTMSLLVAAPAVAEDIRTGAFQFYFARPIGRAHYLAGKLVPVGILVMVLCAVPAVLLALLRLGLSRSGGEALEQLPLLLDALIYAPVLAATLALPPVALGTLTRRPGTAQGLWAALFFLPWILAESVAAATDVPYVALASIPTNLRLVGQHLFGLEPSYAMHWALPTGVLAALLIASTVAVFRRLEHVEVFT